MVKIVFDLPYETHKRFIEYITDIPHLQSMLHGRYVGFIENLKLSKKSPIKMLYQNCSQNKQSNTGRNISFLLNNYSLNSVDELFSEKHSIKNSKVYSLKEDKKWKPILIKELSLVKKELLDNGLESEVNEHMLEDLCIN